MAENTESHGKNTVLCTEIKVHRLEALLLATYVQLITTVHVTSLYNFILASKSSGFHNLTSLCQTCSNLVYIKVVTSL